MIRWSKKFYLVWPILLGLVGFVQASMEVLESPNSLNGESHPEEPANEEEFPSTISELLGTEPITEPITDDLSATTISGDPLNVTESLMNLTETATVGDGSALGGENDTIVISSTGHPEIIEANNTDPYAENDSIKNEESFDSLKPEENDTNWSPLSVQNGPIPPLIHFAPASVNFSVSAFNQSGVFLRSLEPENIGNLTISVPSITEIQNRFSSFNESIPYQVVNYAPIIPVMQSYNVTNSSHDQKTPAYMPSLLDRIAPYAFPVKIPELPENDSNKRPTNSTLPASTNHQNDLNDQLGPSTDILGSRSEWLRSKPERNDLYDQLGPSTEYLGIRPEWFRSKPERNPYAYNEPSLHKHNVEPRQDRNLIHIALPTSTLTTAQPTTTTTKKSGFRSKTVQKIPKVKPTRKPKVRTVVKKTAKTTKGKPEDGFRSGRKVRTVVKRRFRKVVRRATTTRLVFRRRRRTTRLVRKTTTPRLMTTAGVTGNEQN